MVNKLELNKIQEYLIGVNLLLLELGGKIGELWGRIYKIEKHLGLESVDDDG